MHAIRKYKLGIRFISCLMDASVRLAQLVGHLAPWQMAHSTLNTNISYFMGPSLTDLKAIWLCHCFVCLIPRAEAEFMWSLTTNFNSKCLSLRVQIKGIRSPKNIRMHHLLKDIIAISQTGSLSVWTESRRDKMLEITFPPLEPRRLHGPNVTRRRWCWAAACVFMRIIEVSCHTFATLDISAALTFWLHTSEAKPQLYVWRDVKTAALRQTFWDLPISWALAELIRRD